jgi:hypothetical protein
MKSYKANFLQKSNKIVRESCVWYAYHAHKYQNEKRTLALAYSNLAQEPFHGGVRAQHVTTA